MSESSTYRWNTSGAAEAYDAAAPVIHPYYEKVQDEILGLLPFGAEEAFELVDIGGGSGRLAERVLERFAGASRHGCRSVGAVFGTRGTAVGAVRAASDDCADVGCRMIGRRN